MKVQHPKGTVVLKKDECYCRLCGVLTKDKWWIQLYKGRYAHFCRDCWNQIIGKTNKEIRLLLRKRKD